MRVVERAQEGFLLVIAAKLANRALRQQLAVKGFAPLESGRAHSRRRGEALPRLLGICDDEWSMLAAKKTSGVECLQFLPLSQIKPLPNVDESRHGGVSGAEGPCDHRADVGRGNRLGRSVAGVPLVLMARMQNETEIARRVRPDQCGAVHHARDVLPYRGEAPS